MTTEDALVVSFAKSAVQFFAFPPRFQVFVILLGPSKVGVLEGPAGVVRLTAPVGRPGNHVHPGGKAVGDHAEKLNARQQTEYDEKRQAERIGTKNVEAV